jgi:hypothetical protein
MTHPQSNGDSHHGSLHHTGAGGSGPHGGGSGSFSVHVPVLGEGGFGVAVQGMMFMGLMDVLADSGVHGFQMSLGGSAPPSFHAPESANTLAASSGPGGGLTHRPGFEGKQAVVISEKDLTEPGKDTVLFYVHATGIGIPGALRSFLSVLALKLGLVDITYRPNIAEPEKDDYNCILPLNIFENPTDPTMPPGWVPGMFGNTTKLSRRYQNAGRINNKLSLWRRAQLKLWLFIRDHRAPWNDRLFESLAPKAGELYADSQLHLSQFDKPQKVSMGADALLWNYYDDPAKDPKKNYIDSEVKLIIRVDAELFYTQIYQRWNKNPIAFKKNQWLAFLLAKCAFKKLKGFRPPVPTRRQEFLDRLKWLPPVPGRAASFPDGYFEGSATELDELQRQELRRIRANDREGMGQVVPPATTPPQEPDNPDDGGGDDALAALVAITPHAEGAPATELPVEAPESGVDLAGTVSGKPAGKGDIVTVSVRIPVEELKG